MTDNPTELPELYEAIAGIADDADRLRMIRSTLDGIADLEAKLRRLRRTTILDLRAADWTGEDVGELLGVTAQRVSQLTKTPTNQGAHRGEA